jgi:hypothetical protein
MVHWVSGETGGVQKESSLSWSKQLNRRQFSWLKNNLVRGCFVRLNFARADKNAGGSYSQ